MTEHLRPETIEQTVQAVRWAVAESQALDVVGSGSKRGLGRPCSAAARLDTSALSGIVAYEPEELVLTARAGTSMAEIEAALGERRQQLLFEPPNLGPLLGADGGAGSNIGGTLGGVIACNLSGPRRNLSGAARDHLLGFHAVSGRGEVFKSGGRVVKNVTGFDLSKLIAGSYGTLAVMTEVTVRALPASEAVRTVLVVGCDDAAAVRAMTTALQSPYDVSGAAHLPADVAIRSGVGAIASAGEAVTCIRIEGPGPSVAFRADAVAKVLAPCGRIADLGETESRALWREIRDVGALVTDGDRQAWRISVPPSEGARVAAALRFNGEAQVLFDWGGGLLWLSLPASDDAHHERVRAAIAGTGGHATLIRAASGVRERVPAFQPQPAPIAALTQRIKEAFDPHRVLNPGRMVEGV